jgi:hypothetical protein
LWVPSASPGQQTSEHRQQGQQREKHLASLVIDTWAHGQDNGAPIDHPCRAGQRFLNITAYCPEGCRETQQGRDTGYQDAHRYQAKAAQDRPANGRPTPLPKDEQAE